MFTFLKDIFRNFFSKPATRLYPKYKRTPFSLNRGNLSIDPNTCIYCGMCSRVCPVNAIKVDKKTQTWTLDPFHCILCGFCVEKCPKHCMLLKPEVFDMFGKEENEK